MTSESRLLFDLGDILHVRIVCGKCKAAFSAAPGNWKGVPPVCPNCQEQWWLGKSTEEQSLARLKMALEALKDIAPDRFVVQLEFASHV